VWDIALSPESHVSVGGSYRVFMIHPDSPVPLYEQLAALLRSKIRAGELTGRVPSIRSLAEEHGISHKTAERALGILKDEGLLVVALGKGYYVKQPRP
jgi:DNA-binding transcriptional regulator YhcF (GntR family)